MISARYALASLADLTQQLTTELVSANAVSRIWKRDFTLWSEDPSEISNRLGWLDSPAQSLDMWEELVGFGEVVAERADDVVLMGMGGSSLFPEVLTQTFASAEGYPSLHVIDSTDPDAIRRVMQATSPDRTFYIASSKSGSTLETRSHLELFWSLSGDPESFAVITDPGSKLGDLARERGFAHIFENNPDIGGRFAALSLVGVVPAAAMDIDGDSLLEGALDMADALEPAEGSDDNVGVRLAAALGAAVHEKRPMLTLVLEPTIASFGLWLEQLIAESTGKHGTGLIPCVGEEIDTICATSDNRIIVTIGNVIGQEQLRGCGAPLIELSLEELTDIGAHALLWEYAIALSGRLLKINPFDQPDVEAAKVAARALLDSASPETPATVPLSGVVEAVQPGDCLAICAFIDPGSALSAKAVTLRHRLGRELGVATTLGYGPRFLHSTGQLHKGGPPEIIVMQIVTEIAPADDLEIPGQSFGFGAFKQAQAAGDFEALKASGHRAFRVDPAEI